MPTSVRYVGKKPKREDTITGSGIVWKNGEVKIVSDEIAGKLSRHPDIWQIEDRVASSLREEFPVKDVKEDKFMEMNMSALIDLNAAPKDAIVEFALREFGVVLDKRHSRDTMAAEALRLVDQKRFDGELVEVKS